MGSELYEEIKKIVGEDFVSESDFEKMFYSKDVSPLSPDIIERLGTIPDIIVRPRSVKEVSDVVKLAAGQEIPVIPRGGASWWLGGGIPFHGGIVMDLTSLNSELKIDEENLTVTVDCGVTWDELEDVLRMKSYFLGTRPGSAASATVGGWISTGGVGIGSYKYGSVGDLVRSLEVVLPNGEVIQTGRNELASHGSGYNLNWLFIGGEGTLGIITKATLKIIPVPEAGPFHISYSFDDIQSLVNAVRSVVLSRLLPHNIAFGDKRHFEILSSMGRSVPDGNFILCLTLEGEKGIIEFGLKRLDELIGNAGGGIKTCDGRSHEDCENCTLGFRGGRIRVYPVPGEIFVGLARFQETIPKIYELFEDMNLKAGIIGSMVDRRTVMIMPYYLHEEDSETSFMEFHRQLEQIATDVGGRRVGLGLFFSESIMNIHGKETISLMRAIKRTVDPNNIMNPGKTLGEISKRKGK